MAEQENAQPESMEDILSSIRETVEEEAAAVNEKSDDVSDSTNVPNKNPVENTMDTTEEPLDLSDMLDEDTTPVEEEPAVEAKNPASEPTTEEKTEYEEVIDIAEFNATGAEKPATEEKAENARELYKGGEVNPEIMEETSVEEKAEETPPVVEAKDEIIPEEVEEKVETAPVKPNLEKQVEAVTEVATAALATEIQSSQVPPPIENVHLPTSPSADGLQVTFPVEVLASALRPLVKEWVAENLPNVVERLVREELNKLADQ